MREARREEVRTALAAAGPEGISGPELARRLGCSRSAVHRHVAALRRAGLPVEGLAGGYRLAGQPDLVVPALVEPLLEPPLAGPVVWRDVIGSTNDEAALRGREGVPEGLVVGADHQTTGRGRRGRSWLERPGEGLLVSVLLRPQLAPTEAGLLPIVVAVSLADAIEELGIGTPSVAWPNDILVADHKVAGILCELSGDQERVAWAVAGIGINVRSAPVLDDARWPPGALADAGRPPRRGDLLVALLVALSRRYRGWLSDGPDEVLAAFARRDLLVGRQVEVALAAERLSGRARGLDSLGRLRLETSGGERVLGAGEVVRLIA